MSKETRRQLVDMLRDLNLSGVGLAYGEAAAKAEKEGWSFGRALQHAGDRTADEAPIVIQCPPGSGHCSVALAAP